jgi:hypothetical protein
LRLWWCLVHGVAAVGVCDLPLALAIKLSLLAALAANGWSGAPRPAPLLIRRGDGTWAVPELGRGSLRPARDACYAGGWVRLALVDRRGRLTWLLFRDQFEPVVWRALQAVLRRPGRAE